MKLDITATFLALGDATSRNLEFSHGRDVWVSYGEETITETNLLEIRRRHPDLVRVRTFPKRVEARNGADWEWHIIGRELTLKMRVQAKRVQRNDILKIMHTVKSTGDQQRDLLMDEAQASGMKPVYCIYCTEPQRSVWKQPGAVLGYRSFQTGCLVGDAADVPPDTRRLEEIEEKCKPWHHLFEPSAAMRQKWEYLELDAGDFVQFFSIRRSAAAFWMDGEETGPGGSEGWNAPTIDDLNDDSGRIFDWDGVGETAEEDLERLEPDTEAGRRRAERDGKRLYESGLCRMMVMDVRDERVFDESEEVPRG